MPTIPARDPVGFSDTLFDYLVVGGGTAGLVIATRLSEDATCKVGVLEAGSSALDEPAVIVPGRGGQTIGTKYDWAYETTRQEGLNSRTVPWPRGKMLGGSSGMNLLVWNRACKEDYDAWEELGNPGWGWDGLIPYFKKAETLHLPSEAHTKKFSSFVNEQDHGFSGPIHTSYPLLAAETHKYWHATMEKLGISTNRAHLGGSTVGAWTSLAAVDPATQTRSYSTTAYLLPNAQRQNLFVLTEAQATEVLLENAGDGLQRAAGVRFNYKGYARVARCSREVILSAGSMESPHLLELSGIGSPELLQKAGIPVRVENPNVGENLQDHMMTMATYELQSWIKTPDDYADEEFTKEADLMYSTSKTGMRTCLSASFAYLPVQKIMSQDESANYEKQACEYTEAQPSRSRDHKLNLIRQRQFTAASNIGQIEYILDHSSYSSFYKTESGKKYATLMQMLQYPYSRGSLHINPQKPETLVIDPKYYLGEGALDFEIMLHAQKFGDRIWRTAPMNSMVVKRVWPPEDAPHEDSFWRKWIRENTTTDWHPCGTCSMLPRENGGVVDHRLKVYGTTNLRVADVSIFPLHIGGHPQATVYAVGEKAADMIREDAEKCVNGVSERS